MESKKIVIFQPWGGLGDNLQFSTLPELYSKQNYEVYISIHNEHRNEEIKHLVWELNPYVKGFIDEKELSSETYKLAGCFDENQCSSVREKYSFIECIEVIHGHTPTNIYPVIYYKPNVITELNNYILIDLTTVSLQQCLNLNAQHFIDYVNYFYHLLNNSDKIIKIISFDKIPISPIFNEVYDYLKQKNKNISELKVNSLTHYCDLIKSCDTLIICDSGINSLSSAIKNYQAKPHILCYKPLKKNKFQDFFCYVYKNVEYYQPAV
jgi:hypothetical protein